MLVFSRVRSFVTSVVLVAVFVTTGVTFAPPAQAAEGWFPAWHEGDMDFDGPELISYYVSVPDHNVHSGPVTVEVTVDLSDMTGATAPEIAISPGELSELEWLYNSGTLGRGKMTLASGNLMESSWTRSIVIPQGSAAGPYQVRLYKLTDVVGNGSNYFGTTLDTFTVINVAPPTAATPAAVTFTDEGGTAADTYTVPKSVGVDYWIGNKVVVPGTYPGTGSVTVTAKASAGYVLTSGAASSWTTTFKGFLVGATPTISGTAKVGSTLTANPGTWGPAPVTLRYQWYRSGIAITGSTAATRTLNSLDAGKTLTVRVTGSKSGYTPVTKTSAATAAVAKGSLVTATPTITGTAKVGFTLTANPGTWGPAPVTLRYQWYRSGIAITGSTAATRTLDSLDAGKTLTVRVTGSKSGYTPVTKTSAPTAAVVKGSLVTATPTITGTAKVWSTLTANPGTWGPAPVTLQYQWYRSGIAITGSTAATRTLNTNDAGKTLTVRVTGSKSGYTTVSKTSGVTPKIAN